MLKGIQPGSRSDLLSIVQARLPEYDLTGGADNTWNLSMKPSILSDLKNKAVTQAIETIRNRIDRWASANRRFRSTDSGSIRFWCSCRAWTIRAA